MKNFKLWFQFISVLAFFPMLFACDMGELLSVDKITNASRNDVVNLGDSIFALSGEESDFLHSLSGETFRRYAISGSEIEGGMLGPDMLEQYAEAKSDDPNITTIIMDGGGNDILIPAIMFDPYDCKKNWWERKLSDKCKALIDDVYIDAVNTLNELGRDGVKNIIFQGYYNLKLGLLIQPTINDAVDYGDKKLAQAVVNATAADNYRVFVDPRPYINDSSDIIIDGIHPSESGSEKLANLLWEKLEPLL